MYYYLDWTTAGVGVPPGAVPSYLEAVTPHSRGCLSTTNGFVCTRPAKHPGKCVAGQLFQPPVGPRIAAEWLDPTLNPLLVPPSGGPYPANPAPSLQQVFHGSPAAQSLSAAAKLFKEYDEITAVVVASKCECGAAKTGIGRGQAGHSSWCPWRTS